jgi:hypothetical protein
MKHLHEAANELAKISNPAIGDPNDMGRASIPARGICKRCGQPHDRQYCPWVGGVEYAGRHDLVEPPTSEMERESYLAMIRMLRR